MSGLLVLMCIVVGAVSGFAGGVWAYYRESDRVIRINKKELDEVEASLHRDRMAEADMDRTLDELRTG